MIGIMKVHNYNMYSYVAYLVIAQVTYYQTLTAVITFTFV